MVEIAIFGAGGFGREVAWLIDEINEKKREFDIIGFLDDDIALKGKVVNGLRVLGGIDYLEKRPSLAVALAVGNPLHRFKAQKRLSVFNVVYPNLIHPSVSPGINNSLGIGNIFCSGCIMTVNITIGNFCHFNLKSTIGHDCNLSDYTTSACSVDFAGCSKTGIGVYCGNQSTLLPSVSVKDFSIIGAGAVVNDTIEEGSVAVGIPAKIVKKNQLLNEWQTALIAR